MPAVAKMLDDLEVIADFDEKLEPRLKVLADDYVSKTCSIARRHICSSAALKNGVQYRRMYMSIST
jgi:hypothetical protein